MKPELKKLISEHLRDSISREDLRNREAAEKLGIKPWDISVVLNPNSWKYVSVATWEKLGLWQASREHIKNYVKPEEVPTQPTPEPEKQPEMIYGHRETIKVHVEASKPKVKQKRKTDPDKIQKEAFNKYSSMESPFPVVPAVATPDVQFTDTARLKVALDIEINLLVNGQKVQVK